MTSAFSYASDAPSREAIDALSGAALLEFGTDWCCFCLASAPVATQALAAHPAVKHLKVEDGPGRMLGRSFQVKLWPTLIFLADGKEVTRLVRPTDGDAVAQALAAIDPVDFLPSQAQPRLTTVGLAIDGRRPAYSHKKSPVFGISPAYHP